MNGCNNRSACSSTVSNRVRASVRAALVFFRSHVGFCELDVPVAEIVPEEVIQSLHCSVKLITVDRCVEIPRRLVQSRNDPAIVQRSALLEYLRV